MGAFRGYFDDSGDDTDPGHAALSVAGYVAQAESWTRFESAWSAVLDRFNIDYLHMRELNKRVGPFARWKKGEPGAEVEIAELLGALAGVIGTERFKGFGAVIPRRDLRRFNQDKQQRVKAKALAIYGCALAIRQSCRDDDMELFLDRMSKGTSLIALAESYGRTDLYYPFMRSFPMFTALPENGGNDSKNTAAFQAADFLAWELRKNYELKRPFFENKHPRPGSPSSGKRLLEWFTEDRLQHMERHGLKSMAIGRDLMRRSLSALLDAAPIEGIIWDYRALCAAHETRRGVWASP